MTEQKALPSVNNDFGCVFLSNRISQEKACFCCYHPMQKRLFTTFQQSKEQKLLLLKSRKSKSRTTFQNNSKPTWKGFHSNLLILPQMRQNSLISGLKTKNWTKTARKTFLCCLPIFVECFLCQSTRCFCVKPNFCELHAISLIFQNVLASVWNLLTLQLNWRIWFYFWCLVLMAWSLPWNQHFLVLNLLEVSKLWIETG